MDLHIKKQSFFHIAGEDTFREKNKYYSLKKSTVYPIRRDPAGSNQTRTQRVRRSRSVCIKCIHQCSTHYATPTSPHPSPLRRDPFSRDHKSRDPPSCGIARSRQSLSRSHEIRPHRLSSRSSFVLDRDPPLPPISSPSPFPLSLREKKTSDQLYRCE